MKSLKNFSSSGLQEQLNSNQGGVVIFLHDNDEVLLESQLEEPRKENKEDGVGDIYGGDSTSGSA